jgi:hypothetical protein
MSSELSMPISGPVAHPIDMRGFHGWVSGLVHRHRAHLARVVRREGVRADDALDCVQEAFESFLALPQGGCWLACQTIPSDC